MKIGGYLVLGFYIATFLMLLRLKRANFPLQLPLKLDKSKSLRSSPTSNKRQIAAGLVTRWTSSTYVRFRNILKESVEEDKADVFLKGFLAHDLMLAATVVLGRYLGVWQMWVWVVVEVVLFSLFLKFKTFKSKALLYRGRVIEGLFLLLIVAMALVP